MEVKRADPNDPNATDHSTISIMEYDGLDRRIQKTGGDANSNSEVLADWEAPFHYYHDGQRMIETRNDDSQVLKQHVWGLTYIDELCQIAINQDPDNADTGEATENLCERLFYALQDTNFNVLGILNHAGRLIEHYEYTPYGRRTIYSHDWILGDLDGDLDCDNDDEAILNSQQGSRPASMADLYGDGGVFYNDYMYMTWAFIALNIHGAQDDTPVLHARLESARGLDAEYKPLSGVALNDFGHQGLLHDRETGLVYNRKRPYYPLRARFGVREMLGQAEPGGGYQDGMNLYQYVRSAPVSHTDPSGLVWVSVLNTGLQRPAYKGFAPTKQSKVLGALWWKPGSTGPIRVFVDGKQVATVSTKNATYHPNNGPSEQCATHFEWDWDWLKKPEFGTHSGTIQYTMSGETPINATYTAKRQSLKDSTGGLRVTLAEGWTVSEMVLTVYGEYVQFSLGKPLKVVNYTQCVWDTTLRIRLDWNFSPEAAGSLTLGRVESEFGVSTGARNVARDYEKPPPTEIGPNRNPRFFWPSKPRPGREIVTGVHDVYNVWFVKGRSYRLTAHFGALTKGPAGGAAPMLKNKISIKLKP